MGIWVYRYIGTCLCIWTPRTCMCDSPGIVSYGLKIADNTSPGIFNLQSSIFDLQSSMFNAQWYRCMYVYLYS